MSIRCGVSLDAKRLEDNRLIPFKSERFVVNAVASFVIVLATKSGRPIGICNLLKSYWIQLRFYSGGNVRNPIAQKGGWVPPI
jgi:hypothetical protein